MNVIDSRVRVFFITWTNTLVLLFVFLLLLFSIVFVCCQWHLRWTLQKTLVEQFSLINRLINVCNTCNEKGFFVNFVLVLHVVHNYVHVAHFHREERFLSRVTNFGNTLYQTMYPRYNHSKRYLFIFYFMKMLLSLLKLLLLVRKCSRNSVVLLCIRCSNQVECRNHRASEVKFYFPEPNIFLTF